MLNEIHDLTTLAPGSAFKIQNPTFKIST